MNRLIYIYPIYPNQIPMLNTQTNTKRFTQLLLFRLLYLRFYLWDFKLQTKSTLTTGEMKRTSAALHFDFISHLSGMHLCLSITWHQPKKELLAAYVIKANLYLLLYIYDPSTIFTSLHGDHSRKWNKIKQIDSLYR